MKTSCSALLAIASISLGFAALPVSADSGEPRRQITISYHDLDLSRAESASILYERLQRAANKVCGLPDGGVGDAGKFLRCRKAALAAAVRDLNNPAVTALYDGKPQKATAKATMSATLTK